MASRTTQGQKFGTQISHVSSAAHTGNAQVRPGSLFSLLVPPPGLHQGLSWKDKSHGQSWGEAQLAKDLLFDFWSPCEKARLGGVCLQSQV